MSKKVLEPSLLSLDKNNYLEQFKAIKGMKLKYIHYDVMDGRFVPERAYKNQYLKTLDKMNIKPCVHLMVKHPKRWLKHYINHKVHSITFHCEPLKINKIIKLLQKIKSLGFKTGIGIKFDTDLNKYLDVIPYCDIITIMSVIPGKGGQGFEHACLHNLQVCKVLKERYPSLTIEIDGGVNDKIIDQYWDYVDWFVSGSWFFKNIKKMPQYIKEFNKRK